MKLRKLLHGIKDYKIFGSLDSIVNSITDDSRQAVKKCLFVAIRGMNVDAHKFIPDVIKAGASVIVGESEPEKSWLNKISYIKVKDSRDALGLISSNWFGNPDKKLKIIGVTGTKGKTTTVHLIHHILANNGKKAELISTISYSGLHVTTPGTIEIFRLLKSMADNGSEYAVLEVSSHGIDQKRISGIKFDIGVITNLAPEHLDYHKTFKEYKRVKLSFINSAKKKVIGPKSSKLNLLPGKFNNLNAETAIKVAYIAGISRQKAIKSVSTFKLPEGRLEEVENNKGLKIYIDFAHTPESLKAVLSYLNHIGKGRLISVFGCAGNRDKFKRPLMGRISADLADVTIITAEDPRFEDVYEISSQIASGALDANAIEIRIGEKENSKILRKNEHVFIIIPERGEAINFAINNIAQKNDKVIICGKGHEKSMAYKGIEYPWSDREAIDYSLKGKTLRIKK